MMPYVPSLVQVSSKTASGAEETFDCDPVSGLLHRPGDAVPVVERLLANKAEPRADVQLQTVMTKAEADPLDPDVVRSRAAFDFQTLQTDLQKVAPDPDVIRSMWRSRIAVHTDAG